MKIRLHYFAIICGLTLLSHKLHAQTAPSILYGPAPNPNTYTFTVGTAITPLSPTNSGGAVAALAYGSGTTLATSAAPSSLNNPFGMAIDPSGNIYVVNSYSGSKGSGTIDKYNSSGVYQGTFGSGNAPNPTGLTFDASGNAYVLCYNKANNGNSNGNAFIAQFDALGNYVSQIRTGLGTASGIAADASSNLYVAESGKNQVEQYDIGGNLAFAFPNANPTSPTTPNIVAIAVDVSNNIYVLDNAYKNVMKYSSTGTYISTVITGLSNPNSLYINSAGNIYVGDSGTGKVNVYNASGTLPLTPITSITGLTDPRGLVADKIGTLFVADYTNNTLKKYTAVGGYVLSAPLSAGLSFDTATGIISGTPTTSFVASTYTVTAYNAAGSGSTTVTLSCPNTTAPTVSYNPSINVYTTTIAITPLIPTTTNSPNNFTISPALPTGLGISPSTGAITGTPSVTSVPTIYTVTASNGTLTGTTTISIACVVDNYWKGGAAGNPTDWNTAANWNANRVPISTDWASIGVQTFNKNNQPVINGNVTAYNVRFGNARAATLTVQSGATFTVNQLLAVYSNANPTITGAGNVNIAPGALLSIDITANNQGVLTDNLTGKFTLQSDATGSASVDQILPASSTFTTGSINGTGASSIYVERYVTGGTGYRGYRLLSSPVYVATVSSNNVYGINYLANGIWLTGTTGTGGGFDQIGNPTLYLYREDQIPNNTSFTGGNFWGISKINNTNLYDYYMNGGSTVYNIPAGNGLLFFFRGNKTGAAVGVQTQTNYTLAPTVTLSAKGTLNAGQIIVHNWYTPTSANLGYTGTGTGTNSAVRGFNMVGNPYASSIDWNTFNTTTSTSGIYGVNIGNTIYEFNPQTHSYGTYQQGGAGTNNGSRYIMSGEGFFVQANGTSPQLIFNESAKSQTQNTGASLFMATKADVATATNTPNDQHLRLQMALDSINTDDIYVGFNNNASTGYVFNEDAPYKVGTGKLSLNSISSDNVPLAINKLPLPKSKPLAIKLQVGASAWGTYKFNMTEIKGIPDLYEIWLMDSYTKDSLDMRHNTTYSFDITTDTNSYSIKRFQLIIRQNQVLGLHLLSFAASKTNNGAQLMWKTENEQNYTYFTIEKSTDNGATFNVLGGFSSSAIGTYSLIDKDAFPLGATAVTDKYRLKMEDINGTIFYSEVATLNYSASNRDNVNNNLTVYPNPAASTITVTINSGTVSLASNLSAVQTVGATTGLSTAAGSPIYSVKVTNITGAVVKTATFSSNTWQGNVSNLTPGTYIIQVTNANNKSLVGKGTFVKL